MGEMADELIDSMFDHYDRLLYDEDEHYAPPRCRYCGKSNGMFWSDTETGWRLYHYDGKTATPHRCHRGLTPAKAIANFDDLT